MTAKEHELRLHLKTLTKEQGNSKPPILYPSILKEDKMSSPQKPLESLPKRAPSISKETVTMKELQNEVETLYFKLEKKFGRNHQLAVAIEELAELQKELTKTIRGKENDMKICEEIADVEICLDQLLMFYDKDRSKIVLFKTFKLNRLKKFFIEGIHK